MPLKQARLDRFLSTKLGISRKQVKPILAQSRVRVDDRIARDTQQLVNQFSHISFDAKVLQANTAHYVMLNKPAGIVSATRDEQHKTVIDLLDHPERHNLHIVGRLDLNSTGLLLLTNDSGWSRKLMKPEHKVNKLYRVRVQNPLNQAAVDAFAEGMYFKYEDVTTLPAKLRIIDDHIAEVSLTEGRYHQIKRMFGRCDNQVLELHRVAIGNLVLDTSLAVGKSRNLTAIEINGIF